MHLNTPLTLSFAGFAFASVVSAVCDADNCLRAISGTRLGTTFAAQASLDCSSFLAVTVTPPPTTVFTTTTVTTSVVALGKRQETIPAYASPCSGAVRYSSACSCFGILPATTTLPPSTVTETITATATATPTPPPSNCAGSTCGGGFQNCDGNTNCFCFLGISGESFCGQNMLCNEVTACATDADCSGSLCAVDTCCDPESPDLPGICLSFECANPSLKLRNMAKMRSSGSDSAAFKI